MKKVYIILGLACIVISVCMLLLLRKGVSLRTEPLIKPSPIDSQYKNISYGVIQRLFPAFQKAEYVVWGLIPGTAEEGQIFASIQDEYASSFGKKPVLKEITEETSVAEIKNCIQPCWLLVQKEKASELPANSLIAKIQQSLGKNYFSVTMLPFTRNMPVPSVCEIEQRLEYSCILPISVREALRFMKNKEERYFFMRSYNQTDHFIFLEEIFK